MTILAIINAIKYGETNIRELKIPRFCVTGFSLGLNDLGKLTDLYVFERNLAKNVPFQSCISGGKDLVSTVKGLNFLLFFQANECLSSFWCRQIKSLVSVWFLISWQPARMRLTITSFLCPYVFGRNIEGDPRIWKTHKKFMSHWGHQSLGNSNMFQRTNRNLPKPALNETFILCWILKSVLLTPGNAIF